MRITPWVGSTIGRIVAVSLRRVTSGAALSVTAAEPELETSGRCDAFADRLLRDAAVGHVIVPFWSAHQLTIALLSAERFGLRPAMQRFEVVVDDSLGGEIMRVVGEWFGLKMRAIHTRGNPRRLEDVGAWIRNPSPFFVAVDGGCEYGTVPTGIVRLAARLGSMVWPVAIRARPMLRCPGLIAEIPMPGARVALGIGAPFRVDRAVPVASGADELKRQLDAATVAVTALLDGRPASIDRPPRQQTA